MSGIEAIEPLIGRGLSLWRDGEKLRYQAPPGLLSAADLDLLRAHKVELLAQLAGADAAMYGLSPGQEALWYLNEVEPDSAAYNVAFAARIVTEGLDERRLGRALDDCVARHPALRTVFPRARAQGARPSQRVLAPPHRPTLRTLDASAWTDAELRRRVDADYRRPFDVAAGPLTRFHLYRTRTGEPVLLLVVHHLVCDFWSLLLILDEVAAGYSGRPPGHPSGTSVRAAIAAEARTLAGQGGDRDLAYWLHQLRGELPVLDLPVDRRRVRTRQHVGATVSFALDEALTADVERLARASATTVYVVLLAAFQTLLHRYSGQDDLLIGTLTNGRGDAELRDLVGYFVNPVVLRTAMAGSRSFAAQITAARGIVADALQHSRLPFPVLVERLRPRRDPGLTPIFQAMFALHRPHLFPDIADLWSPRPPAAPIQWGELQLAPFPLAQQEGQFDLSLEIMPTRDALFGELKYATDLFEPTTAERIARQFTTLLRAAVRAPTTPLAQLPILDDSERRRIVTERSRVAAPGRAIPSTLQQPFEAHAARYPGDAALLTETGEHTYGELNARANRLGAHLVALGACPGELIGVCLRRTSDLIVALLAILKTGAGYVPLDPAYPKARLRFMLGDSGARCVLSTAALAPALGDGETLGSAQVLDVDSDAIAAAPATPFHCPARAGDIAYVLYTSGSTGTPKGVMIPHASVAAMIAWARTVFSRDDLAGTLAVTSVCFDLSVFEIFVPLSAGGRVILADDALHLASHRRAGEVTLVNTVPSAMTELCRLGALPPSLRVANLAGEPLTRELVRRIAEHPGTSPDLAIYNLYGPSEDTTYSTFARIVPSELARDPRAPVIGRAIAGSQAYVLDDAMQPVPDGVVGELYLGGAGLARGYKGRPRLTAESFVPDPISGTPGARLYRTGDIARYRADGQLEFLGRRDHQVKLRGFRIELGEIEACLGEHPAVQEAVVVAAPRPSSQGIWLVAYVATGTLASRGAGSLPQTLADFVGQRLPDHMVPGAIVVLAALPHTPNGKVDRSALPAPSAVRGPDRRASRRGDAPETAIETALAGIWSELLSVEHVARDDNFFELGGDSILGILVVARAAALGLELRPGVLAQHQTVASLAAAARPLAPVGSGERRAGSAATAGEAVPLTPIQRWFFATEAPAPQHFNQSVLLAVPTDLDPAHVAAATRWLIERHQALRMRFTRGPDGWSAQVGPADAPPPFEVIANTEGPGGTVILDRLQASLDITTGPVLRVALIRGATPSASRLAIVAHHLVVDTVSWHILLDDLRAYLEARRSGARLLRPPTTTTWSDWARRLERWATSAEAATYRRAWPAATDARQPLPPDHVGGASHNTMGSVDTVTLALDETSTQTLLSTLDRAYGARLDEALLAALVLALADPDDRGPLIIDVETHGRDAPFAGVDLSRTVGWFTALFPVTLSVEAAGTPDAPAQALRTVKDAMRAIPWRGLPFGALRYLAGEHAIEPGGRADISFNYLGRFSTTPDVDRPFALVDEPRGVEHDPERPRSHLVDVVARVWGGQLEVALRYSRAVHAAPTFERLADQIGATLRSLADDCARRAERVWTPGDFPAARLTQTELDTLMDVVGRPDNPDGAAIHDIYTLTPMQEGMLFHSLHSPRYRPYVDQLRLRLPERIDAERLRHAATVVMARHGVLRTTLHWEGLGRPHQVVRRDVALEWAVIGAEDPAPAEALRRDRERGFELDTGPLVRWTLVGRDELVMTFHHALLDGWSLPLVIRDLLDAYRGASEAAALLPPSPDFRRYVEWLQQRGLVDAEAFWRAELAGFTEPTVVLGDRRALAGGDANVVNVTVPIPEGLAQKIARTVRAQRVTASALVQAAWALTLGLGNGDNEVVFGATVSGRPGALPDVQRMVGLFINTVPARVRLPRDDGATTGDWLRAVHRAHLRREEHGHAPLTSVRAWSDVPPGAPLFDSLVVVENYPDVGDAARAGVEVEISARANYPISLVVLPPPNLEVRLSYDASRFGAAAAASLGRTFVAQLSRMIAAIELPATTVLRATEVELARMTAWNRTGSAYPRTSTVSALFREQALATPDAPACEFGGEVTTYRQLLERANALTRRLRAAGVEHGDQVAIGASPSSAWIAGLIAILNAGAAYVPLDPGWPSERTAFVTNDTATRVALVDASTADRVGGQPFPEVLVRLDAPPDVPLPGPAPLAPGSAGDPAYIIYTSGSTGAPKGIVVPHRAIVRLVRDTNYVAVGPGDRVAMLSNPAFDAMTFEVWAPLLNGGCIVGVPEDAVLAPAAFAAHLRAARVTTLFITTALFNQVAAEAPAAFAPLDQVLFGGEAVDPRAVAAVLDAGGPTRLLHVYGPTESTTFATWYQVDAVAAHAATVPIGRPIANTTVWVLDEALRPVPLGTPGELYLGGDGLAIGYHRQGGLTADRFIAHPLAGSGGRLYRTGDRARQRDDGALEFIGRTDRQIKLRGFRIELGEVEAALAACDGVQLAAAILRTDTDTPARLVAYACGRPGAALDRATLVADLQQRLPAYMVPAAVVVVDAMPLNRNGKIDYAALPVPSRADTAAAGSVAIVAPSLPAEAELAAIWSDVLSLDIVGVDDNFFALGGDSIQSILIVSRARAAGLDVRTRDIFEHQTVAGVARALAKRSADAPADAVPEMTSESPDLAGDSAPLTPIQAWFFERAFEEPHHFNLSCLLALDDEAAADLATLDRAVHAVVDRHDALRLRFHPATGTDAGGFVQSVDADARRAPLRALRGHEELAALQRSFDLAQGPTVAAAVVRAQGRPALLLSAHHLTIDTVSLEILADEIGTAWRQLRAGQAVALGAPPTAFTTWARWLRRDGVAAVGDPHEWLDQRYDLVARLPGDINSDAGDGRGLTIAGAQTIEIRLGRDDTEALTRALPAATGHHVEAALLAALARAVAHWTERDAALVAVERHGREALLDGVDVTRSVGWFTAICPVVLQVDRAAGAMAAVDTAADVLGRLARGGVAFGVLRYGHPDHKVREALASLPTPEVSLNFLGRSAGQAGLFTRIEGEVGPEHSPRAALPHALSMLASVRADRLLIDLRFGRETHRRAASAAVAESIVADLHEIADGARAAAARHQVQGVEMSRHELAQLLAELEPDDVTTKGR